MANSALVVSSVLLGALVVAIVWAVSRRQGVRAYSHALGERARVAAGGVGEESGVRADPRSMMVLVVLVGLVVGAVVVVREPMVFMGAMGLLLVGYFSWGVYYLGRSRGMGKAHAIGLSAWMFTMVLTVVVSVKLLLG